MRRGLAVWLGALFLVASACGGGTTTDEGTEAERSPAPSFPPGSYMATIQQRGELRVGVKFDVPQFGLVNRETGQPEGFDVDMAKEVARAIGVKATFTEAVSANRIPFLNEDKVDIVFSTMTINEERKKQIDFSDVYYVAGQTFLYRKGKAVTIQTAGGKKICTATGSTTETNLKQLAPKAEVVLQEGYGQCFQLLQNDQVDAMATDDVILTGFLKTDPKAFEIAKKRFSLEPYGAGIKKARTEFVEFVNGIIRDMKEDDRWAKLYARWVGSITGSEAEPPPESVEFKVGVDLEIGLEAPAETGTGG